jgi:multiple sugar transport system substrate-binding protein
MSGKTEGTWKKGPISRRRFLQLSGLAAAGTVLWACAPAAPEPTEEPEEPAAAEPTEEPAVEPEPEEVMLTHWVHPLGDDLEKFEPLIAQFREKNPNIDITIEITPWGTRIEKNMSAWAAGTSPDISYLNVDEFTTYVAEGALVELDDFVTQEDLDDLLPGPRFATDWEGHIYEFPVLYAFRIAVYNKSIWEASGLDPEVTPITWDELDETLTAIKEAKDAGEHDAWPMTLEGLGHTLRLFNPWFYQSGGTIVTADGQSGYDSDAGVEAMTFAVHLFDDYCSPGDIASDGSEVQSRFGLQEFAYNHNAELSFLKITGDEYPDVDYGVAHAQENKVRWTHGGVGNYGIWRPEQANESWLWIDFLTNEANLQFNNIFGFVPPRQSVLAKYAAEADEIKQAALDEAQWGGVEKHPRIWDMWDVMNPECQAALAHEKTPEQAVQDAAERLNAEYLT